MQVILQSDTARYKLHPALLTHCNKLNLKKKSLQYRRAKTDSVSLLEIEAALLSVQSLTQGTRACDALALQRRVDVCLSVLAACGIG